MALHMKLMVNDGEVGRLIVTRIQPQHAEPDYVCLYEWQVALVGAPTMTGRVHHRYGDNAWALVEKVLDAYRFAQENQSVGETW